MARPRFKVNDEKRKTVQALAGYGLKQEQIAKMIGIRSTKTLRKHFQSELESGSAEANAQVAQTLFKMASSGKHLAATIFFLKTRAKWSEKTQEEVGPLVVPTLIISREANDESHPD
jgi:transposase